MSEIIRLTRQFRMGATTFDDINPDWTPRQVLDAYVPNFPVLASATIEAPVREGDTLVYNIAKPVPQTKGGLDAATRDALKRLDAWIESGNAPSTHEPAPHWIKVHQALIGVEPAGNQPLLDPRFIAAP